MTFTNSLIATQCLSTSHPNATALLFIVNAMNLDVDNYMWSRISYHLQGRSSKQDLDSLFRESLASWPFQESTLQRLFYWYKLCFARAEIGQCRALGIVYGDIGTSPLYVFNNIFVELRTPSGTPSKADVLGATSLVIWTIILIVFIKYACIVMLADDNGEGAYSISDKLYSPAILCNGHH